MNENMASAWRFRTFGPTKIGLPHLVLEYPDQYENSAVLRFFRGVTK